jgi:hypothetical protein
VDAADVSPEAEEVLRAEGVEVLDGKPGTSSNGEEADAAKPEKV